MTKINLGVKALLSWVNSLKLCDQDLNVNDFQDGTVLLKVVYMLKQEPISSFSNSVEDRFRLVADFLERDCRFNASKGTPLSWSNIKDGINVTVEVAKVLLLLVYQDIMSECCSLKKLDCDMEVRKLQRQMMNERDYRDGLERELSSKLSVIAQKETHINQLQHCLDKLKKEQINGEQAIREQITDLENKNKVLQMRLHEILKENKEAKSTSSLLEHKMDELTEENSILSSQVRTVRLQLAIFEAEVRSLTGNQASAEKEWKDKTSRLECNLNQVTTQKELLAEEIEILQGKISSLEDELNSISKEEVGENMGPIMEQEIDSLNKQMQTIGNSLDLTQKEFQTKGDAMAKQERDRFYQKELLQQQLMAAEESQLSALNIVMKEKDGNIKALKEELAAQAHVVHVLKEEHSKHIQILQQKIQQINEQVETASQKLVAKEQELLQMKRDSAQQLGILQQQLTSAKAEKKATCDLQLATHKDKEILMVRVGQAEKERRALENQLEALILQKDTLIQAKTAEHYKAQMEKAVSHYNKKKQLLQESQEEVTEIKQSLALKESQLQAALTDNKVLQLDLDKAQTNEKELLSLVASLEVQLASADQKLRAQNEIVGQGKSSQRSLSSDGMYKSSLGVHSSLREKRTISSDSLGQSSLEDSLNNARHFSTPDESSTPLIHSSERLAAKCRALGAESLETLYFTPINNRSAKENKREFVSGRESPASLVKRRRTTQVISITMTKNTPETPTSDRLIGLPGYRRSAVYSKSTGTFCVGAENEPDGAPEDWMRIAELQARNKACLPHLKSSYPVEFDTGSCHAFVFTDEELRTGDPADTIRRASMMPSQLQHSLSSHPLSPLMANSANTRSHRLSLMPGAPKTQLRSPKDTKRSSSLAPFLQRSPEKKGKAGCFPHPLTPKNKNVLSGPSNALLHPNLSLAERRQSTMFTIDNTPKNSSYLRKGLNKLRSSTRKSPCKGTKTSNAQNRGQENVPTKNTHTAVGRAGRKGKSPQLAPKGQKNSLWATSSKTAKSPRLTASACKSDSDEEKGRDQESSVVPVVLLTSTGLMEMGLQMIRSESPETLDTLTSKQTKPFGAVIIDTRSELGDLGEEEDDDMVEGFFTHSPEPQEPVESEAPVQPEENSQPDRLHPEQDLPHIFKSIQAVLSGLTTKDLFSFKMCLLNSKKDKTLQQATDGDILDFVDKMLEVFGSNPFSFHNKHITLNERGTSIGLKVTGVNAFVDLNNLFRLKKRNGQAVRTVVTTGIPGIGMTVSVGKFCLDWAELCANKDLQFIIALSFHHLWALRNSNPHNMSFLEMIHYYHPECNDMNYLEVEDCRLLIIIDSFDGYLAPLDWENAPVIKDSCTPAHLDVLIVNLIRGTLLPGGCVWILGRRAAVSQIPSQFLDVVTEIQGFSDQSKDEYLIKRFSDAELATKIVAHYKRLPTLKILAGQPIVCWMMATVFEVWSNEIKLKLIKMGRLAFHMLQRNSYIFSEEDVMECGLNLIEVTVFSGLCTELPTASSRGRRNFCYVHLTFQEFMAALYVFTMFRSESKNVLDSEWLHMPNIFISKPDQTRSVASLLLRAVELTLRAPLGHYDMFLRFLCGLLSPDCHDQQLGGFLFPNDAAKVSGLDEAQQLLQQTVTTAQQNNTDRVENLKECLREMTQLHK
ncbi:Nuclear mitotic apparatus protein 1 [Takifugu flavidus]|uniref:Nuclear mitotic apparatus protein 1 n=1 Tax=Takifugu flavidus TaxID=433684 RepID=A0A5C6PFI2_9TELE|nr:Nuclear mitotic apparatus protein 1 [Takifugu flavidus]